MATAEISELRVPPQNLDAEHSILGAVLLENDSLAKTLELLSEEDFYRGAHRIIYRAMVEISERHEVVDQITLTNHLKSKSELEQVGGATYLAELVQIVPSASNIRHHCKIVREKALLRGLIKTATTVVSQGYEEVGQTEDLLEYAEREIFQLAQGRLGRSFVRLNEIVQESVEIVDRLYSRQEKITGIPTGFADLDDLTAGLQSSDLIIIAGRPSMGSWLSYGLGSANENLPTFISMVSRGTGRPNCQPLYDRLWGSGFLPSQHQGVQFRSGEDHVLYLNNPDGIDPETRRQMLDGIAELNATRFKDVGDPEIQTRIAQYEMAYRMQTSVPDLTNVSDESQETLDLYGPDAKVPGTHAANCLLARRLAERGVRFIQIYHRGWDHHGGLPGRHPKLAKEVDQGSAALVMDLKRRGMLDDTLVIWGGEFGRTVYRQGGNENSYGRDHHPRCFSLWMAGGGVRGGMSYGETDEWGYNIIDRDRYGVHVHDLNATILHLMGLDHEKLSYRYQGLDYRLTGVEPHKPVKDILL